MTDRKKPSWERYFSWSGWKAALTAEPVRQPCRCRVSAPSWGREQSRRSQPGGFALSPIRAVDAMRGAHGNVGCRTNTERFSTVRLRISIRSRWHLSYLYSRASRPRLVFCEWLGWLQAHNADIRIVSGPRHKPSDRERAPNRIISTTMIGKYFAGYLCPFGSASSCLIE